MMDFNLELAKKGFAVGIDGLVGDVRIVCFDFQKTKDTKLLLVLYKEDDVECILLYHQDGTPIPQPMTDDGMFSYELFMKTERQFARYDIVNEDMKAILFRDLNRAKDACCSSDVIISVETPYKS